MDNESPLRKLQRGSQILRGALAASKKANTFLREAIPEHSELYRQVDSTVLASIGVRLPAFLRLVVYDAESVGSDIFMGSVAISLDEVAMNLGTLQACFYFLICVVLGIHVVRCCGRDTLGSKVPPEVKSRSM
jgi:hypothetical protein